MKVMNIIHDSVVDGEGLRTTVFFAGCPHKCFGCHNPESWSANNGREMTLEEIFEEIKGNPLADVTFSGGEPFEQIDSLVHLAKRIKNELNKNIWIYTGYTYEQILSHENLNFQKILEYCDVLIDGKFELDKRDLTLDFRGSSNQRVIDLNKLKEI